MKLFRQFLNVFVTTALTALVMAPIALAAETNSAYKELEWQDLVPEHWQPAIIQPAPDEVHHHIDKASLVSKLQHKLVKLPGFMIPVDFIENRVSGFLLVPFLEHHVIAHIHHDANQMVYVALNVPLVVENPYQPLWVTGEILLEPTHTEEGSAGYKITHATAEIYRY